MGFRIFLANPVLDEEMIQAATDALKNERFLLGESVLKFEEEFAKFIGTKYAVSVNSGTDALFFSLLACNIENKEVITTPMSFVATANTILYAKGIPVFADIEKGSPNINPGEISKNITNKTGCILPVHLHGHPARMKEILDLAKEKGLSVIEDDCQAHGAKISGKMVGGFGDVGTFSFYPAKNMTVGGDGGMITTNNEHIADLCRKLRNGGSALKYEHVIFGYTSRMSSVHAAIGRIQLKKLLEWNEKRMELAEIYYKHLSHIEKIALPPKCTAEIKPVYHMFVIRTDRREELKEWLKKDGIETGIHYPIPIHLQPIYKKTFRTVENMYPNSENFARTCLSLPIYPDLSVDDVKFVCEKIQEFFR